MIGPSSKGRDWTERAACKGLPTAQFFPESKQDATAAAAICSGCAVQEKCLTEALADRRTQGIWGGYLFTDKRGGQAIEKVRDQ